MRLLDSAKLLLGSWFVFGAVVALGGACGKSGDAVVSGAGGGGRGGAGHGAASGSGAGMVSDAFADEPGSRLRPNVINGADGSKHALGTFRDTDRSEDCSFTDYPDGTWRCIPTALSTSNFFADAGCSEPLAIASACAVGPTPKYTWSTPQGTGCGTARLYSTGARFNGAQAYTGGGGSACSATPTPAVFEFYRLGSEVNLSSFVGGTKGTD